MNSTQILEMNPNLNESESFEAALEQFICMTANLSDPRRKTELCKLHMIGKQCPYGDKCNFAHGENELKSRSFTHPNYKTVKCRNFYMDGYCCFGARCQFIHKANLRIESNQYTTALYGRVMKLSQLKKERPLTNMHDLVSESADSEGV